MEKKEQLAAIRQKCIEANDELVLRRGLFQSDDEIRIRLADVLLAIGKRQAAIAVSWRGEFLENQPVNSYSYDETYPWRFKKIFWNLRQDSLDQQSDETISFIHSLLV